MKKKRKLQRLVSTPKTDHVERIRLEDIAERCGRAVECCIVAGDCRRALNAVRQSFIELSLPCTDVVTEQSHLDSFMDLDLCTYLAVAGIEYVWHLTQATRAELLEIENLSVSRINRIAEALELDGFWLSGDGPTVQR